MCDTSGFRFAFDTAKYTPLQLRLDSSGDDEPILCIPVRERAGGILLATPVDSFDLDMLSAEATGDPPFAGAIGPYAQVSVAFRGANGRQLGAKTTVLMIDVDLECLDSEGGTLLLGSTEDLTFTQNFGLVANTPKWLSAPSLKEAVTQWFAAVSEVGGPADRTTPYETPAVTADTEAEGSRGLPVKAASSMAASGASFQPAEKPDLTAAVLRLTELLSGQAASSSSSAPPPGMAGVPELFRSEASKSGLDMEQLKLLLAQAGGRLQAAGADAPSSVTGIASLGAAAKRKPRGLVALAPAPDGLSGEAAEAAELAADTATPPDVMTQLLMQNNRLLQHLTHRNPDPFNSLMPGGSSMEDGSGDAKVGGVRGCAARQTWKTMTRQSGSQIRAAIRARLADEMEVEEDDLQPAHMRGYFERKVPLGAGPRLLTYMSYLIARMWELSETGQTSELATLISLAAVFCEQVANDGGRCQVAWLFTGLQTPAFNLTQRNTQRLQEEPFAALADPRWMAAQMAYLKDLDWFNQRQASQRNLQQPSDPTPKPRAKPKPKAKSKAKGKGKTEEAEA